MQGLGFQCPDFRTWGSAVAWATDTAAVMGVPVELVCAISTWLMEG